MKWFKHMTASADDEKLSALVGKGGIPGLALYGAYWRVAEIVALQIEKNSTTASVSYPSWRWAQKLFVRKSVASSLLVRLQKAGLLVIKLDQNCIETVTVEMPNLLKYRDEYSRKSGHTPDNVAPEGKKEGEEKKEEGKAPKAAPPVSLFLVPDWVPSEPWQAWLKVRTKKRAVNTDYALGLAVRELEKLRACGEDPSEVLNQAIVRSYTGLFPVHTGNGNGNGRSPQQQKVTILSRPGVSRA